MEKGFMVKKDGKYRMRSGQWNPKKKNAARYNERMAILVARVHGGEVVAV